jgi:hypothetical protein
MASLIALCVAVSAGDRPGAGSQLPTLPSARRSLAVLKTPRVGSSILPLATRGRTPPNQGPRPTYLVDPGRRGRLPLGIGPEARMQPTAMPSRPVALACATRRLPR